MNAWNGVQTWPMPIGGSIPISVLPSVKFLSSILLLSGGDITGFVNGTTNCIRWDVEKCNFDGELRMHEQQKLWKDPTKANEGYDGHGIRRLRFWRNGKTDILWSAEMVGEYPAVNKVVHISAADIKSKLVMDVESHQAVPLNRRWNGPMVAPLEEQKNIVI